jgi:hypothetical protein
VKKRTYVLLVSLLLVLVLAAPAWAGRWIQAEGNSRYVLGSQDSRTTTEVDGKCIIVVKNAQILYEGTFAGEARQDHTVIAQGPCEEALYPGVVDDRFWVKGTFAGEVDGREGTCRYVGYGQTWAGSPPTRELRINFFGCTGRLKGMRAVLNVGWEPPYSGWVHFGRR